MAEVRLHANRVLRRRALSDGTRRGVDGYFSLNHGEQPSWWLPSLAEASAIGVFENHPGSERDALVIEPRGLIVRSHPSQRLLYAEIAELVPPRKAPLPEALECRMKDGTVRSLPVLRRDGQIMDVYRFLLAVVGDQRAR